ncbi:MAG: hypothetical protein ACHQNE_01495 [Candidatus Kapaibacterium sp.]
MKNKRFTKIAVLAAMALLCSGAIFTSAWAQCPCPAVDTSDAQHIHATPPWNGHTMLVDTMFGSCEAYVCYECRVTSAGNDDYKTNKVCIDSECWARYCATHGLTVGTPASDSILISQANYDLFPMLFDTTYGNPCGFSCPQCPGDGTINWDEFTATCWDSYYDGGGKYELVNCGNFGWCLNAYTICCNNGKPTRTFLRSVNVTWTCSEPDCELVNCPPPQNYPATH